MATPRVDTMLELKQLMVAYHTLLSGEFDQKIADTQKTIDEANKVLDTVLGTQTLDQVKQGADAYAVAIRAQADKALTDAQALQASLEDKATQFAQATADHAAEVASFAADKASHEAQVAADNQALAEARATAQAEQERLDALAGKLNAQQADLVTREAALADKLAAMKALAA